MTTDDLKGHNVALDTGHALGTSYISGLLEVQFKRCKMYQNHQFVNEKEMQV